MTINLALFSPIFYLWNDVRILLVAQAFWISFSALAIFLICRKRSLSPLASLGISIIYSLFYGIQTAVFFDFHPIVFGVGLVPWLCYFLETKKTLPVILSAILLLLTQENMGVTLMGIGLYYIFFRNYRAWAISFVITGLLYTLVSPKLITFFSSTGFQYTPALPVSPVEILSRFFDAPEKRQVFLYSFSWFSFLPIFSPGAILSVLLDLSQYFITGSYFARMWSPLMHHRAILAPFLTLGTLDVLVFLKHRGLTITWIVGLLFVISLANQYLFHFPLNKLAIRSYWATESWMADNDRLLFQMAPEDSIVTQQSLVPHLSHRKEIYLFYPRIHDFDTEPCGKRSCWWLDFAGDPKYLIVDLHPGQWLTQLLETNDHVSEALKAMEVNRRIHLVRQIGEARLYEVSPSGKLR